MNFKPYDIKTHFTLLEAAYLWCEKEIPLQLTSPAVLPHDVEIIVSEFKKKLVSCGNDIGERICWGEKSYQNVYELIKDEDYFKKQADRHGHFYELVLDDLFPIQYTNCPFEADDFGYDAKNCEYLYEHDTCDGCDLDGSCEWDVGRKPAFDVRNVQYNENDILSGLFHPGYENLPKEIKKFIESNDVSRDGLIWLAKQLNQKPAFLFPAMREPTSHAFNKTRKELEEATAENKRLGSMLESLKKPVPTKEADKKPVLPKPEKTGWANTPAKFGRGVRSHIRKFLSIMGDFWLNHWQWIIGLIVAIIGLLFKIG